MYSLHLNCISNNKFIDACHYQEAYEHPISICSESIGRSSATTFDGDIGYQ